MNFRFRQIHHIRPAEKPIDTYVEIVRYFSEPVNVEGPQTGEMEIDCSGTSRSMRRLALAAGLRKVGTEH